MIWIEKSESGSHGMPRDTSNVTRGLNRTKLPFLGGYVAIAGRDCNLQENEGRCEIRVQMAILEMPQMAQNGPFLAPLGQSDPGAGSLGPDPHRDRAMWTPRANFRTFFRFFVGRLHVGSAYSCVLGAQGFCPGLYP